MQGYYLSTGNERVVELDDFPQQSTGAPMPLVISDGCHVILSYLLTERIAPDDPNVVRNEQGNAIGFKEARCVTEREAPATAFVSFSADLLLLGGPNDEALHGHPLYERGLGSYGVYEVLGSDLPKALERINSVHHSHDPEQFEGLRHLIFTFHDGAIECVTYGYSIRVESLPQSARLARMCEMLDE
ncbi:hypothetical protein IT575_07500 [bacterium]|nr:hypothetical protein [bacterium]